MNWEIWNFLITQTKCNYNELILCWCGSCKLDLHARAGKFTVKRFMVNLPALRCTLPIKQIYFKWFKGGGIIETRILDKIKWMCELYTEIIYLTRAPRVGCVAWQDWQINNDIQSKLLNAWLSVINLVFCLIAINMYTEFGVHWTEDNKVKVQSSDQRSGKNTCIQTKFDVKDNINWRSVHRKNMVINVEMSSWRAPWQNGPCKNQNTQNDTQTRRTSFRKTTISLSFSDFLNTSFKMTYAKPRIICVWVLKG